jgi:hypothetical protein
MKERRKARRYGLTLSMTIQASIDNGLTSLYGKTLDISTRGVCFTVGTELNVGTKLGLIITVPPGLVGGMELFILAVGQVARVERPRENGVQNVRVAAAIRRYECFHGGLSDNPSRLLSSLAKGLRNDEDPIGLGLLGPVRPADSE